MFLKNKEIAKTDSRDKTECSADFNEAELLRLAEWSSHYLLKHLLKPSLWFSQLALHNRGILRIYCMQMDSERQGQQLQHSVPIPCPYKSPNPMLCGDTKREEERQQRQLKSVN